IRGEAVTDLPQDRGLASEARGETVRHAIDRLAEPGLPGDRALENVRRPVECGVELLLGHVETFLPSDPEESLLPGDALCIERASEVEKQNARRRHYPCPEPASFASSSSSASSRGEVSLAWWPRTASPGPIQRSSRPRRTRPQATPME